MATKTFYFKNAAPSGASTALSLQDGGTAPSGALTTTGWTVAKIATGLFSQMLVGSEKLSTTFVSTSSLFSPSFNAASCWRSETTLNGTFNQFAGSWTFTFRLRAQTAAASQTGRVRIRVWKSTNADGTGATQHVNNILTGSTTAALSTTVSQSSTITWSPNSLTLTNEYLWVQCEWEIVAASGNNSGDVLFYVESAGTVTTPDFVLPAFYTQRHFRFRSDTDFVDAAPTWKAAEDVSVPKADYAAVNRLRVCIDNTGGTQAIATWVLNYSKNGGAYTPITASSSVVQGFNAGASADDTALTTQRLSSGTGTFTPGRYEEDGTTADNISVAKDQFTEFEYGLTVVAADVAVDDIIDFRIYRGSTPLNSYAVTPRLTVGGGVVAAMNKDNMFLVM